MKKRLAILCTLAMAAGISMNVVAANGLGTGGTDSAEVTGTYQAGQKAGTVYSVDITWENLEFTYKGADEGTWNPKTHQYDGKAEAGWVDGTGTISVTNHSNTDITASASYQAEKGFEEATMNFSEDQVNVESADNGVDGAAGTPVEKTISVTPSGTLPEGTTETAIGNITIAIQ